MCSLVASEQLEREKADEQVGVCHVDDEQFGCRTYSEHTGNPSHGSNSYRGNLFEVITITVVFGRRTVYCWVDKFFRAMVVVINNFYIPWINCCAPCGYAQL